MRQQQHRSQRPRQQRQRQRRPEQQSSAPSVISGVIDGCWGGFVIAASLGLCCAALFLPFDVLVVWDDLYPGLDDIWTMVAGGLFVLGLLFNLAFIPLGVLFQFYPKTQKLISKRLVPSAWTLVGAAFAGLIFGLLLMVLVYAVAIAIGILFDTSLTSHEAFNFFLAMMMSGTVGLMLLIGLVRVMIGDYDKPRRRRYW